MVDKIRRKPIKQLNNQDNQNESDQTDSNNNNNVTPDQQSNDLCFSPPEEAGWVEQCSEQRFLVDKMLNDRVVQMRQIVDSSMEKFLRSQQTYDRFQKVKSQLQDDLQAIVASVCALKKKIGVLTKLQDNSDQSVLFQQATKYWDCLDIKYNQFEQLLEEESQQWIYQTRIASDRLQNLVKDLDGGLSKHISQTQTLLTQKTDFSHSRIQLNKIAILEAQLVSTADIHFEWPTLSDLISFPVGQSLNLSGLRYIATKSNIRAIVAKLSNQRQGKLIQSPRNHPSQLESNKELHDKAKLIKQVQVLYHQGVPGALQQTEVRGIVLKDDKGVMIEELYGNGCSTEVASVELGEHDVILGFYGSINSVGQAIQSLGIICYNTKQSLFDD